MNQLNSIIIEGTVTEIKGNSFTLESTRYDRTLQTFHFHVKVNGSHSITTGMKVRVVGRIEEYEGDVSILAEYAENIARRKEIA